MTNRSAIILLFLAFFGYSNSAEYSNGDQQIIQQVFGVTYDKFDWDLFKRLDSPNVKNILISPLSLKMALAVLYEASSGITRKQLEEVLEYPLNETETRNRLLQIRESLKTPASKDYILDLGSRLYLDKNIKPQQKFSSILQSYYEIDVVPMDASSPKQTAKDANDWVKSLTHGNIESLISEDDLEDVVVLLLTSVFFKGTWVNQFLPNNTKGDQFHLSSQKSVNIPLMRQENKFYFRQSKSLDAKIIRLPYQGNKLSMVMMLPNSIMGLPDLIKELSASRLKKETQIMDEVNVKLAIPKLHFDFSAELVSPLKTMGVNDIFENTASLPGLARGAGLRKKISVSNILQKSGIDINELGSTAYSATEISLVNKFGEGEEDTEEFIVNKPFLFYIEDEDTKQILFIGKVDDPTLVSGKIENSDSPTISSGH